MADTHYLGIVAKKNPKYGSGHEVAKHIRGGYADTLVKVELYSGAASYHPLNLPKEQENLPGQKLVEYVNKNHPDLNTLVTGDRTLQYQGLKEGIVNESYKAGRDVKEVVDRYKTKYKAYKMVA
jgi:hypothetical protein